MNITVYSGFTMWAAYGALWLQDMNVLCLHGVNSQTIITIAKPLCKYVLHFEIWAKLQIHK